MSCFYGFSIQLQTAVDDTVIEGILFHKDLGELGSFLYDRNYKFGGIDFKSSRLRSQVFPLMQEAFKDYNLPVPPSLELMSGNLVHLLCAFELLEFLSKQSTIGLVTDGIFLEYLEFDKSISASKIKGKHRQVYNAAKARILRARSELGYPKNPAFYEYVLNDGESISIGYV